MARGSCTETSGTAFPRRNDIVARDARRFHVMQLVRLFAISMALAGVGTGHRDAAPAGAPTPLRLEASAVAPTAIRLTVELADHSLDLSAMGGPEGEPPRSWALGEQGSGR
jgi:hypothetical protein